MGSRAGTIKSAARKLGITVEEWERRRQAGEVRCTDCKEWKTAEHYYPDRSRSNGLASKCRSCASDRVTAWRYGTTASELREMSAEQDGRCVICARERKLVVDHDHESGDVRGLLCSRCNVGLGLFCDSVELLEKAIVYLEERGGEQ